MMKRFACIILIILLLGMLWGCTAIKELMISFGFVSEFSYNGWKTVELTNYGTIKIPEDWVLEELDGYYFIKKPGSVTGSYETVLFQSKAYTEDKYDVNPLQQEIRFCESISATGLSTGPIYGERRYSVNGAETTRWFIEIHSDTYLTLLFLSEDPSLDEDMIRKLAASVIES